MSDTSEPAGDPDGSQSVVYRLGDGTSDDDVAVGERYHAVVNGVVDYGVFVDVSESVSGLVHESDLDAESEYEVGDELVVELLERRANGDLSFAPVRPESYETVERFDDDVDEAGALRERVGDDVTLVGEVVQVKQTGGPTLFRVRDETGTVQCAAFVEAGIRAHPDVGVGDAVRVRGTVETREGGLQVEVDSLAALDGEDAETVLGDVAAAASDRAEPPEVEPLVDWPAMEKLRPGLRRVARRLRETVLESRPIRIRHHADGDGMAAAVPVLYALQRFVAETHEDPEAARHLLRRLPSKAPFYEMEDATRDLSFALQDRERHGQKLPLLLMLDNGSTEEDTPAYEAVDHYDIPVMVVDHHHPDEEAVEPFVDEHVNPYLHGEDYAITTGMMCVELARLIHPGVTGELRHVPAVAGISDRSDADAMSDYLALAHEEGYEESFLQDVSEALDYLAYWLRYSPGNQLIRDVLNVDATGGRHRDVVPFLADNARDAVEEQLAAAKPHVERERAENGAHLCRVDVENHAYRFTYPAPGKTTGELHDRIVEETGDPVITIGYGPDFAVLRSDGVRLDIPQMVQELNEEIEGGGVQGGGHLVVGSIKFVPGMREAVLDALVEKMGDAELDEDLTSSA